jgi:hypothetical protein
MSDRRDHHPAGPSYADAAERVVVEAGVVLRTRFGKVTWRWTHDARPRLTGNRIDSALAQEINPRIAA